MNSRGATAALLSLSLAIAAAAEAGERCAEARVDELLAAMTAPHNHDWNGPAAALGRCGDAAVPALAAYLGDRGNDAFARRTVAWTLGMTGSELAVEVLVAALEDSDPYVAHAAASSLGDLGEAAVASLVAVLRTADAGARAGAVRSLSRIDSPRVVAPLLDALGDCDVSVRMHAALALGARNRGEAADGLMEVLGEGPQWLRARAARMLGELRASAAVPGLIDALADPDWQLPTVAAAALVAIGPDSVAPLMAAADATGVTTRMCALRALGQLGRPEAIPVLTRALGDPSWMVREEASVALTRMPPEAASSALLELLEHADGEVRSDAEWVLGQLSRAGPSGRPVT